MNLGKAIQKKIQEENADLESEPNNTKTEKFMRTSNSIIEEESKESTQMSNFDAETIWERGNSENEDYDLDPVQEEMYEEEEDAEMLERQRKEIQELKRDNKDKENNLRELMKALRTRENQI